MALASEEEWESDPELRQMRKDFVASFAQRREALEKSLSALREGKSGDAGFEQALEVAVKVAHKLAGAAETYGFPTLTLAAAALEDWVVRTKPPERPAGDVAGAVALLAEMLARAQSAGKDAKEFAQDARFAALKALADGAGPED